MKRFPSSPAALLYAVCEGCTASQMSKSERQLARERASACEAGLKHARRMIFEIESKTQWESVTYTEGWLRAWTTDLTQAPTFHSAATLFLDWARLTKESARSRIVPLIKARLEWCGHACVLIDILRNVANALGRGLLKYDARA